MAAILDTVTYYYAGKRASNSFARTDRTFRYWFVGQDANTLREHALYYFKHTHVFGTLELLAYCESVQDDIELVSTEPPAETSADLPAAV